MNSRYLKLMIFIFFIGCKPSVSPNQSEAKWEGIKTSENTEVTDISLSCKEAPDSKIITLRTIANLDTSTDLLAVRTGNLPVVQMTYNERQGFWEAELNISDKSDKLDFQILATGTELRDISQPYQVNLPLACNKELLMKASNIVKRVVESSIFCKGNFKINGLCLELN